MLQRFPKIPKVREYAVIELTSGTVMRGHVFIEATTRIQDLLNSETLFFPFVDEHEQFHLLNKTAVARVQPFDEK